MILWSKKNKGNYFFYANPFDPYRTNLWYSFALSAFLLIYLPLFSRSSSHILLSRRSPLPANEKKDMAAWVTKARTENVTVNFALHCRDLSSTGGPDPLCLAVISWNFLLCFIGVLGVDGVMDSHKIKVEAEAVAKKLLDLRTLGIDHFTLLLDSRKYQSR